MAEELVFKTVIETANSAQTLGEVKKSIKDINDALNKTKVGSKEFDALNVALGKSKGHLTEMRENLKLLNPEQKFRAIAQAGAGIAHGFEAAKAAQELFGRESEDLLKVLTKIQAATALANGIQGVSQLGEEFKRLGLILKANPIMLIASVVVGIGIALYELKDRIPIVGKAFTWLGEKIDEIVQAGKDFTDWIGLTSFKMDEMREATVKRAKETADAEEKMWERRLKYAQAAGKETIDIERKLNDARLTNLKEQAKEIYLKAFSEHRQLTEEEKKQLDEIKNKATDVYTEIEVKNIEHHTKRVENEKKANEKTHDERLKHLADIEKAEAESNQRSADLAAYYNSLLRQQENDDFNKKLAEDDELVAHELKNKKENDDKLLEIEKQTQELKKQLQIDGFQAAMDLTNTLFANALLRAKGNAVEERKIRKAQFNLDKALAATQTGIAGAQAVVEALKIPPPAGEIIAGTRAVITGVQLATILAKKFPEDGTASGGGNSINTPNVGSGGSAPSIQSPQASNNLTYQTTQLRQDQSGNFAGFGSPLRAYVVESEITSTQKRIRKIQDNSSY